MGKNFLYLQLNEEQSFDDQYLPQQNHVIAFVNKNNSGKLQWNIIDQNGDTNIVSSNSVDCKVNNGVLQFTTSSNNNTISNDNIYDLGNDISDNPLFNYSNGSVQKFQLMNDTTISYNNITLPIACTLKLFVKTNDYQLTIINSDNQETKLQGNKYLIQISNYSQILFFVKQVI